jgi:hypothetical protein
MLSLSDVTNTMTGVDFVQEKFMGAGPQDNESALEQAKDEQVCVFSRTTTPLMTKLTTHCNRSRITSGLLTRALLVATSPSRTRRLVSVKLL